MKTSYTAVFVGGLWAAVFFALGIVLTLGTGSVLGPLLDPEVPGSSFVELLGYASAAAMLMFMCSWIVSLIVSPLTWLLGKLMAPTRSRLAHVLVFTAYGFVVGYLTIRLAFGWIFDTPYDLIAGTASGVACGLGWWLAARVREAHTDPMDEIVALYDTHGREVGVAPRSVVRRENLHHAATAVVVFNSAGEVFVHQRTATKDLYPSRYDFAAGGVLLAGEDPTSAAVREAAEELGVTSPLTPIGAADFTDAHTSYHGFLFWTVTDEPLALQPEEVAGGRWMKRLEVVDMINRRSDELMPDTVALLGGWLRDLPTVPPA